MASYDIEYQYDARGNRVKEIDHLASVTTTYVYDAANQLLTEDTAGAVTTYTYDASGNCTKKEAPGGTTFYEYDEDNHLTKASPPAGDVDFEYNPDGQRVKKATAAETKHFLYDYERLLEEYDDAGDPNHEYTQTLEEYGDLISEYGDSGSSFYQYDAQGNADALLDDTQSPTDRYRYLAFGLEESHTGSSPNSFTYVGRQNYFWDAELELYYLGMGNANGGGRPYDPATGRFLSEDPRGYLAGSPQLYRYTANDPVNARDPSGQKEVPKHKGPKYEFGEFFLYVDVTGNSDPATPDLRNEKDGFFAINMLFYGDEQLKEMGVLQREIDKFNARNYPVVGDELRDPLDALRLQGDRGVWKDVSVIDARTGTELFTIDLFADESGKLWYAQPLLAATADGPELWVGYRVFEDFRDAIVYWHRGQVLKYSGQHIMVWSGIASGLYGTEGGATSLLGELSSAIADCFTWGISDQTKGYAEAWKNLPKPERDIIDDVLKGRRPLADFNALREEVKRVAIGRFREVAAQPAGNIPNP